MKISWMDNELRSRVQAACAGIPVKEVAARTGVHAETVRRYLNGSSAISAHFLAELCRGQSLSADWLLCGWGGPSRQEACREALHTATKDELLNELQRRLETAEPTVPPRAADGIIVVRSALRQRTDTGRR